MEISIVNRYYSYSGYTPKSEKVRREMRYVKEEVPGDGWCSMHAVDQLLQCVAMIWELECPM